MIVGTKQSGPVAKEILDFYHDIYLMKFQEKPVINGGRDMKSLKEFFSYNDLNINFLKACVIMYINLDNTWLAEQGYPMWNFPDKVFYCKRELDYNYKFFKGDKEEYYKDYVKKTIDKLSINNDGEKHRRKNQESSKMD